LDFSVFSWKIDTEIQESRMAVSGREIDQKLRLTAAVLGAVTRKDLAAAFRRINPKTPFDVERAHKWLQGRARPRERQVYDDWAKLLGLGRSGQWIAECDIDAFIDALCTHHDCDCETLRSHLAPAAGGAATQERKAGLGGTYACYSHAWSPYFRGRLIRGELSITATAQGLAATYSEVLPTGRVMLEGLVSVGSRVITIAVREGGGDAHFIFCLFLPRPPASLLTGLMCGATIIGSDAQPSVTRIAIVRLPEPSTLLRQAEAYLPPHPSVAHDLATLGLRMAEPAVVDRQLMAFLTGGGEGGLDQLSVASHRALVELFDRNWLAPPASPVVLADRRELRRQKAS
jgi:hypothetical protein